MAIEPNKTFINIINSKKPEKLTYIFNKKNNSSKKEKCKVGKENLTFDDDEEKKIKK